MKHAASVSPAADLILQAAPSVFEGDTVALRCREKPGSALSDKGMYKDGSFQRGLRAGSDLHIHWATQQHNGWYQCKARRKDKSVVSNAVQIQVLGKARVVSEMVYSQ